MAELPNQNTPPAAQSAAAGARADITSAEVDALLDKNKDAAPSGTPQPYDLVARDKIVTGSTSAGSRSSSASSRS
jgi:hypothetical protein